MGEIEDDSLADLYVRLFDEGDQLRPGEDSERIGLYYRGQITSAMLRTFIAQMLYRTSIVGLKIETHDRIMWSHDGGRSEIPQSEIDDGTRVYVHKMLWRALGIRTKYAT